MTEYLETASQCVETLIEKGTDRYGRIHSPIWMAILDVETLDSPHNPLPLDEHVRVGRRGRRAPAGSNLNLDQAMIRAAYRLTELTGDARYQTAAEQYIVYYLDHFIDPQTKLVEWG